MDTPAGGNADKKENNRKIMSLDTNKRIVLKWKDAETMSFAAATLFTASCVRSIEERGKFIVALSGGNTPKRLYQLLATKEFSRTIPWEKVFLFWGDERFVPPTDTESNYRMVKENLLTHISIPEKNIFPVPVEGTATNCAKKYEKTITRFWDDKKIRFDCMLLGIGNDGHTASLFPGTDIVKEKKKLVKEVWVEEKQTWRISVTLPLINDSRQVVFLVTGKEKAAVVAGILSDKKEKKPLPSQLVNPKKGIVYWLLDDDAAGY